MYAGGKRAGGGGGEGGGHCAQQPFCPLEWLSVPTFCALPFFFFFLPRVPGVRREDLGSSWPFWFQLELDYSAAHGLHINEIIHDVLIHTGPGHSGEAAAQKKKKRGRIPSLDNKISDAATGLVQKLSGPRHVTCFCALFIRNGRSFLADAT